jgi:signal transduction histidine kinase
VFAIGLKPLEDAEHLLRRLAVSAVRHQFGVAQNGIKRGAQLVAHVGKELPLEPLAADKKLGFKVEVAPKLPSGRGDGRRLTQVLINLVGNAIKFIDTGEVAINAEAHNGSFHVSVRDTGPGISAADQAKLFQEFQQADNAITKKKGGTGLGLAISKRIIEMHGGRIWVKSQPGQGSTFTFTLPVNVERQVEPA